MKTMRVFVFSYNTIGFHKLFFIEDSPAMGGLLFACNSEACS